jgi:hypothetical protein
MYKQLKTALKGEVHTCVEADETVETALSWDVLLSEEALMPPVPTHANHG